MDNVVNLPERTYCATMVFVDVETREQMMLVKLDKGSRSDMEVFASFHRQPNIAIARGLHLFGTALKVRYPDRKFASDIVVTEL